MPRQARLIYRAPDGHDQEVALSEGGEEVGVGRHPQCALTVQQPSVSRRHARFWFEGGSFHVQDLQSSNGTYVNNQRINQARLSDGDTVRCGDFVMSFREVPTTPARAEDGAAKRATSDGPRLVGRLPPQRRPLSVSPNPNPNPGPMRPPPLSEAPSRPEPPRMPDAALDRRSMPTMKPSASEQAAAMRDAGPFGTPSARRAPTEPPTRSARPTSDPARAVPDAEELRRLREEVAHWKAQAEGRALLDNKQASAAEAELAVARAELDALRAEVEAARATAAQASEARSTFEKDVGDVRADIEDKKRRIHELEQSNLRAEEQIRTLTDNSLKLKDQARTQQNQLEEYRREKVALEVALVEARERIAQFQANNEASMRREAEQADAINDLKREVRQKEKAQKEVEKQLEVAKYDLQAVREMNENLRLALGTDDEDRSKTNRRLQELEQVLAEKEAIIETLEAEVRRLELRLQQGEAEVVSRFEQRALAAEKGRHDAEAESRRREATLRELAEQVKLLQAELNEADRRAEKAEANAGEGGDLRRRLTEAETARDALAATGRDLQARVAALTDRSAALERDLAAAEQRARDHESQGASSREVMAQLNDLRRQNRDLQSRTVELTERAATLERELAAAEQRARDADGRARDTEAQGGREAMSQLNDLRRQNRELKHQLESLEADLAQLKAGTAVHSIGPAASVDTSGYDELRDRAVELFEAINDVASDLKTNVELVGGYLSDLRPMVETAVNIANDGGDDRLREAVEEIDAAVTIDSAEEVLSQAREASDSFKRSLRAFREVLQRHGYGS